MSHDDESFKQSRKIKKLLDQAVALKTRADAGEVVPNTEQLDKIKKIHKLLAKLRAFEPIPQGSDEHGGTTRGGRP